MQFDWAKRNMSNNTCEKIMRKIEKLPRKMLKRKFIPARQKARKLFYSKHGSEYLYAFFYIEK